MGLAAIGAGIAVGGGILIDRGIDTLKWSTWSDRKTARRSWKYQ